MVESALAGPIAWAALAVWFRVNPRDDLAQPALVRMGQ
jgi:hypothetical protein